MIDESKILQHGESSDFALASIFAPSMYSTSRVTKLRSASSTINWVKHVVLLLSDTVVEAVDGDEVGLFVSYNPNEVGVMEERLYRNIPLDIDNMEGMHLNHISMLG